jgi:hypothetical protein
MTKVNAKNMLIRYNKYVYIITIGYWQYGKKEQKQYEDQFIKLWQKIHMLFGMYYVSGWATFCVGSITDQYLVKLNQLHDFRKSGRSNKNTGCR